MKPVLLCVGLLSLTFSLSAQTLLTGKVTQGKNEPVIFGSVALYQGGVLITGGETNFDGRYKIELEPGLYQLEATYVGLEPQRIDEVMVHKGETNLLDLHMEVAELSLETIDVIACRLMREKICISHSCPLRKRVPRKKATQGEAERTGDGSLKCFPVPATDQVSVVLKDHVEHLQLYTLSGQLLRQWGRQEAGQQTINLSNYPSGTYLLEATAEEQRWAAKIIVQR